MRRLSLLLPGTLLLVVSCGDTPTGSTETGPIQMNVIAATTAFVRCGQEIPVTATATDAKGKPVKGMLVNFNVLDGGGSLFGGAAITTDAGVARDYWTLGSRANVSNTLAVRAVDPRTGAKNTYFTQTVTTLSKIAFAIYRDDSYEIYTMYPDGTGVTRLPTTGREFAPAWSPDGSKIAVASYRDDNNEIYVMDADGSNPVNLTNDSAPDAYPAWSPDGSKIAFSRNGQIYVMNSDGSNPTPLTTAGRNGVPAWSPDGRKIAFVSDQDDDIHVMNADGSGKTNLTNSAASDEGAPVWSPDGSRIAFTAVRGDNPDVADIYVMDADGSNPTRLTTVEAWIEGPAWSGCTAP